MDDETRVSSQARTALADSTREGSVMDSAMSMQDRQIDSLEKLMSILSDKLQPLLAPVPLSEPMPSEKDTPPTNSPLTAQINSQTRRISNLCTIVENLRSALEI